MKGGKPVLPSRFTLPVCVCACVCAPMQAFMEVAADPSALSKYSSEPEIIEVTHHAHRTHRTMMSHSAQPVGLRHGWQRCAHRRMCTAGSLPWHR